MCAGLAAVESLLPGPPNCIGGQPYGPLLRDVRSLRKTQGAEARYLQCGQYWKKQLDGRWTRSTSPILLFLSNCVGHILNNAIRLEVEICKFINKNQIIKR